MTEHKQKNILYEIKTYILEEKNYNSSSNHGQEKINNLEIIFRNTCNLLRENVKILFRKTHTHIPDSLNDGKAAYLCKDVIST